MIKDKITILSLMLLLGLNGCSLGDRADRTIGKGDPCIVNGKVVTCPTTTSNHLYALEKMIGIGANHPCEVESDNYDNTNILWQEADCDEDGILNGAEDNVSLGENHKISDPYDASSYFL